MKYRQITDGDWIEPVRRGYRTICCDCGLVHRVNFRLQHGRIQFQVFREARATAAVRRGKRHKKV